MEFKKLLLVLIITITIIMFIMFGGSYAWYAYSNAESNVIGSTIKETPTVIFSQNEYIASNTTSPIYDEDRYAYANKNSFSITLGQNLSNYQTGIEISLKDIVMSDELKNANYKYELIQDGKSISSGNFENIGNMTNLIISPMQILNPNEYPHTYNYEFYIWLSEDGTNQNNLMNKGFSARINIDSAIKK